MNQLDQLYPLAFSHGQTWTTEGQTWRLSVVSAGEVSLPSGRIVACDPLVSGPRDPFVQQVRPGRYIVDLALASAGRTERVALARIRFTARQPAVWVMAVRQGEKRAALAPSALVGYASESGTGAFMDASTADEHDLADREDIDDLLEALTANYRPHRYWLDYPVARKQNIVLFSAGDGEGTYTSYFGIDEAGDVCALVTDFQILSR